MNIEDQTAKEPQANEKPRMGRIIALGLLLIAVAALIACLAIGGEADTGEPEPSPAPVEAGQEQSEDAAAEAEADPVEAEDPAAADTSASETSASSSASGAASKPSANTGGSASGSSSSTASSPSASQHSHSWEPVTVHHDAVYEQQWVENWVWVERYRCGTCGTYTYSYAEASAHSVAAGRPSQGGCGGFATAGYEEDYGSYQFVCVQEAWDEVVGYKCSCGATK